MSAQACFPALFALSLLACARTPAEKAAAQIKTVQVEEAPDRLILRGKNFAAVGDFARAEQYFAAAIEHGAEPRSVLPLLFRVCAEERRYRAAIDYAEPHLKKHPDDYRLRFVVASFLVSIGDNAAAREHLEQIAKDKPTFAPAHFALAVILRDEAGDVISADGHFREYLRLDPRGPHAEEARASLLKLVDHGASKPITVPPVWHDVAPPGDDKKKATQ